MTFWVPMRKILLPLSEELLIEIDEAAKAEFSYRTEYIRRQLLKSVEKREFKAVASARLKNPVDKRLLNLDDS